MNDLLSKFQNKIDGAINVLNALQNEYSTMLQSIISNKIDYFFIDNVDKRNELEVLSRQLNMHLNGAFTPKQRERFDNVCRLAHKQMEGSLRYFFFKYYDKDLEKFRAEHIAGVSRNNLSWEEIKPKTWRSITFSQMYTVMNFIQRNDEWYTLVRIFNDYRNTLSHFGYFEDTKEKEAKDPKFKKFKDEMPVLVVLDLLEETLFSIQIKLDEKKRL